MNRNLYLILQSLAWRSQPARAPVIQKTDPAGSDQPATEGAMTYIRKNVYSLPAVSPGEWPDWFLWYARGIKALQAKPIIDKLSWRYYGAIHGFNAKRWNEVGQFVPVERLPPQGEMDVFWNQCQHRSWYFLPWHRGYLLALEDTLRETIAGLPNGPQDWSLCYWNYYRKDENRIPDPFLAMEMPDGEGPNPLYVPGRTSATVPHSVISTDALKQNEFTARLIWPGFGGPKTGFVWAGNSNGALENDPHNIVHGSVGGLMGSLTTAALDPIFWLHHANVDRLWETWVRSGGADPTDTDWVNGPIPTTSGRVFVIPRPMNHGWTFTPGDMSNMAALGYTYDSFAPLGQASASFVEDGFQPAPSTFQAVPRPSTAKLPGEGAMSFATPELVAARDGPITVVGYEVDTVVEVDGSARSRLAALMAPSATRGVGSGSQLAMKIENVTGDLGGVTLSFYIAPPGISDPSGASDLVVGSIGLFGLPEASDPDGPHGGEGLNFILDLTNAISGQGWQGEDVMVRIVSLEPVPDWANITIGKISIFLQAG